MTPDMIAENARTFRKRGFAEPDAVRRAMSPQRTGIVPTPTLAPVMRPLPTGPKMQLPGGPGVGGTLAGLAESSGGAVAPGASSAGAGGVLSSIADLGGKAGGPGQATSGSIGSAMPGDKMGGSVSPWAGDVSGLSSSSSGWLMPKSKVTPPVAVGGVPNQPSSLMEQLMLQRQMGGPSRM